MDQNDAVGLNTDSASLQNANNSGLSSTQQQFDDGQGMQPVLPVVNKEKKSKKSKVIIIFCVICLVTVGLVIALVVLLPKILNDNLVVGEWACYKYNWSNGEITDKPINKLILDANGSFEYGPYDDMLNNHFAGDSYEYDKKNDISADGYVHYMIEFGPTTEYVLNGVRQDITGRQMSDLEMAIGMEGGKREAMVIFEDSYLMYRCIAE